MDDLLPPEMSGEIRTSLLNMEYEADFLGEKIKWNGTFLHWRLPKAKSEAELGEIRAKCLERWMGVLKYWDAECRKFFDPKSNLEVDMAAQMAALGLERDKR